MLQTCASNHTSPNYDWLLEGYIAYSWRRGKKVRAIRESILHRFCLPGVDLYVFNTTQYIRISEYKWNLLTVCGADMLEVRFLRKSTTESLFMPFYFADFQRSPNCHMIADTQRVTFGRKGFSKIQLGKLSFAEDSTFELNLSND